MTAGKPTPAPAIRIRPATGDDAAGILAVYAPYIATPVTFEERVPPLEEFGARMAGIQAVYPCLAAVVDKSGPNGMRERIVGYACAHEQHPRAAYGWNAELSVYLAPEAQGRNLGGALYRALLDLLRSQGVKTAYALVTVPNAPSERLHASFGFQLMGMQENAGYTCGAWHDVAWFVKQLAPFDADPAPILPFPALATARPEAVREALGRANASMNGQG